MKKFMLKNVFKNKDFWVIIIYIIFLLLNSVLLDSKTGDIWDKWKSRKDKLKSLLHQ